MRRRTRSLRRARRGRASESGDARGGWTRETRANTARARGMESARAFDRVARDRAASREDARARFRAGRGAVGTPRERTHVSRSCCRSGRRPRARSRLRRRSGAARRRPRGRTSACDRIEGRGRRRSARRRGGTARTTSRDPKSIDRSIDRGALQTRKTRTPDAVARAARVNAVAKKRRARERRRARGNGLASTCVARVAVATRDPSRRRARPVGRMVASHNLH